MAGINGLGIMPPHPSQACMKVSNPGGKELKGIKTNKAAGHDGISTRLSALQGPFAHFQPWLNSGEFQRRAYRQDL